MKNEHKNFLIRTTKEKIDEETNNLYNSLCTAYMDSNMQTRQAAHTHFTNWLRYNSARGADKLEVIRQYISGIMGELNTIKEHKESLEEIIKIEE